jgi:hypothetical protein
MSFDRMSFERVMEMLASLDTRTLERPWAWRDRDLNVREALYRTLEDEQEALGLASLDRTFPEAQRSLMLAQRAFGDLRGLLVGLPTALLDAAPQPNEWTVRQVLEHLRTVERRYAMQTLYAVERGDAEPVRIPEERLKEADGVNAPGDVMTLLHALGEDRAATTRRLSGVEPAALTRPTIWAGYDVDVRFRLHRFAVHLTEHTVQCEKTLDALGRRQEEGRRIVRRIWALRGELEAMGALGETDALDARYTERAETVKHALS